jgi:hypothetical protein
LRPLTPGFTERETRVEIVRIESGGVWNVEAKEAVQFGFVVAGEGSEWGEGGI